VGAVELYVIIAASALEASAQPEITDATMSQMLRSLLR
jgi:hypothetical protein